MRRDKERALKFRLQGMSYAEIQQFLGVPKGTLSGWFGDLVLSDSAQKRLRQRMHDGSMRGLLKKNKLQRHKAEQLSRTLRSTAMCQVKKLDSQGLFLVGVSLYWAEGYKLPVVRNGRALTSHPVSLTNSDPRLVRIFVRFLREVCKVPDQKLHISMRLYEHMNEKRTQEHWMKVVRLPAVNFRKTYYGVSKSSLSKRPYTRLPYGTVQVRVNDTKLFHTIMGWIEGLAQQIP